MTADVCCVMETRPKEELAILREP